MDGTATIFQLFYIPRKGNSYYKASTTYAVFRLERFTEVPEFTYLGKHFPCVNAN